MKKSRCFIIMHFFLNGLDSNSCFSSKKTYSNHLGDMSEHMIDSSTPSLRSGRALRVIPRGKQRLTVYRAHQISHPSIEKISRLMIQNSLRICQNFPETKSDPTVLEMLRVYSSGLSIWQKPVRACTPKVENFMKKMKFLQMVQQASTKLLVYF